MGDSLFFSITEMKLRWGVSPKTIVHVGAHKGEEYEGYKKLKPNKIYWVEANSSLIPSLESKFKSLDHVEVINAMIWSRSGEEKNFIITNNIQSSSILELKVHSTIYPEIFEQNRVLLRTTTLDEIFENRLLPEFINLDIQGAELEALKGSSNILKQVKYIYTEVNSLELYEDCPNISDIDSFLASHGFGRIGLRWWGNDGWGDAIYIRDKDVKKQLLISDLLLKLFFDFKWYLKINAIKLKIAFEKASLKFMSNK
jgi:FkbM family methyltransferase